MSQVRFVTGLPRPEPGRGIPVETPMMGPGTATPTARGIHVTWDKVRLPEMRRGVAVVDVRIGIDAEAAWVPVVAQVGYANGMAVEGHMSPTVRDRLAPILRGECLAAGSEMLVTQPEATVAALRGVSSELDDETLSGALDRVIERLDTDPRLRSLVESSRQEGGHVRDELEGLARSLRPDSYGM